MTQLLTDSQQTFYATAAQVIPVLMIAMALQFNSVRILLRYWRIRQLPVATWLTTAVLVVIVVVMGVAEIYALLAIRDDQKPEHWVERFVTAALVLGVIVVVIGAGYAVADQAKEGEAEDPKASDDGRSGGRAALPIFVAVGALAILVGLIKFGPEWLAQPGLKGKDRAEDIGRARTALLATAAGLIAIVGSIVALLNYRLSQEGHFTDRFTKAIDQLGDDKLDVRLGGIYALERIAKDSRNDHPQVMEVLTAYIREHSPWPDPNGLTPSRISTDIQAAIDVIGRRTLAHDNQSRQLDLRATNLRGVHMVGPDAHFERVGSSDANLENAYLLDAGLDEAAFLEANLEGAYMVGARLRKAMFFKANLEGANLELAHLDGADLRGANWDESTRWPDGFDYKERTGPARG